MKNEKWKMKKGKMWNEKMKSKMMNPKLRRWKISTDKNKNKWNNLFEMFKNKRIKYFRSDVIVQLCHERKYLKTFKRRIGGEIKIFLFVIL